MLTGVPGMLSIGVCGVSPSCEETSSRPDPETGAGSLSDDGLYDVGSPLPSLYSSSCVDHLLVKLESECEGGLCCSIWLWEGESGPGKARVRELNCCRASSPGPSVLRGCVRAADVDDGGKYDDEVYGLSRPVGEPRGRSNGDVDE